nr:HNH endonuclease signature motif containing protein [Escherichia coli]
MRRSVYAYEIPNGHEIDHIDGDKKNNNIDNLRAVSRAVNSRNKRKLTGNTSGVTGVDFLKRRNEWRARLANAHLGWFPDFPSACEARIIAEVRSGDVTGRHGT